MELIPNDPAELKIIERSIPGIIIENHLHFFGFEFHFNFRSSASTRYEVVDKETNLSYFIGNTPIECENWIRENCLNK